MKSWSKLDLPSSLSVSSKPSCSMLKASLSFKYSSCSLLSFSSFSFFSCSNRLSSSSFSLNSAFFLSSSNSSCLRFFSSLSLSWAYIHQHNIIFIVHTNNHETNKYNTTVLLIYPILWIAIQTFNIQ